jgi:hypothetical protein
VIRQSLLLLLLFIWLCIGCSDVVRYLPFLHAQANSSKFPLHFLYRAYKAGDPQALSTWSHKAIVVNDGYWIHFASESGASQAQQYLSVLRTSNNLNQGRVKVLNYAANQGDVEAQIALYRHWMTQGNTQNVEHWLALAARKDPDSALEFAKWLSLAGEEKRAITALHLAQRLGSQQAAVLLTIRSGTKDDAHVRKPQNVSNGKFTLNSGQCAQQLQFVADSLHSVMQGVNFIAQFENDERLETLPICINSPLWLTPSAMECSDNWQRSGRLGCDVTQLSESLNRQSFTHVVVLAETGKANVHNGVMFLDSQDDYNVFVHELAHFAGFVDEYPLSSALARSICHSNDAPNLKVTQKTNKADISAWLGQAKEKGITLSPSRTCDNHSAQAYKPSDKMTFMEFYDVAYIPPSYLKAWAKRLQNRALLIPAYINFYQASDSKGDKTQGQYWRSRYQQYLQAD